MDFQLTLRRKPFYYIVNLFVPTIILSISEIVTFWIAEQKKRIKLSLTNLLAYSVVLVTTPFIILNFDCYSFFVNFQTSLLNEFPNSSENVPIIIYYINAQMIVVMAKTFVQGLNSRIAYNAKTFKVIFFYQNKFSL